MTRVTAFDEGDPRTTWTALEFGGTATAPAVAAVCAVRSDGAPKRPPADPEGVLDRVA